MRLSKGMPEWIRERRFWMSPPRTSVWLLSSTTGSFSPTWLNSCLTSRDTVPCSPMRGVTLRMMPASLYSTACVMELPVIPPVATGTC